MLLSVILVWAIIAVELLHVENVQIQHVSTCWRCEDAFKSVYDAALTIFQQIVAGDSWGELSIPLALHQPWTAILLFAIMMTISLGCMNLILAVIVERATEARENDQQRKMQKKDAEQESYMVEMALLCDSMDIDGNGHLSLEEMLEGYDHNPEFKNLMQQMDIRRSDIKTIFNVLDGDCSGEVSYVEFCQQLGTCRKRDPIMMHSLIKYSVMELQKSIQHDIMEKLNEHTEALIEQREMLHEELQLLYALPVDPKVKEAAQKRRAQRVLRRQGKKQGNPQYFDDNVADNSATAYGPTPEASSAANQVINSLESTCRSFEDTQSELQALVKHAEELTSLALSPEQPGRETGDQLQQAAEAAPVEGLLGEGLQEKGKSVSFGTDAGQLDGELERRFSGLLKTLRHRMSEEEELQRRCKEAIQTIDMLLYIVKVFDNADRRMPIDKDEIRVRRTIGAKKDDYSLDGKTATRNEVFNLLESCGFTKSNPYYIVQQGKVAELTLMDDRRRLELLKEISGAGVYDERRAESVKLLQETSLKRKKTDEIIEVCP
eukprot:symbB.v1.2.032553.t1/scaffold3922.1/size48298/5